MTAEEHLKHFCAAVLELLREEPAPGSVLSGVIPALVRAIGEGSRATVVQLRQEIRAWEAASEPLLHLSRSPFIPFHDEAAGVLAKLVRVRTEAARIIEALEALQLASPESAPAGDDREEVEELDEEGRAPALFEEAEERRQAEDFSAAEALYGEAVQCDPALWLAHLRRGQMRVLLGQPDLAVDDLTRALQLRGDDPVGYWWRGDARAVAGRYDEAIEDYSRALELRPDLFVVRYNRAVALRQRGDLDRALVELDQLLLDKPGDGPLHLNRGLIFLAREELQRAAAEFQTALRHLPDSHEAQQRLQETRARLRERSRQPAEPAPQERAAPPPLPAKTPTAVEVGARNTVRETPLREPSPGPPINADPSTDGHMAVKCPGCGEHGKIRWDKLQRGRVVACPHCKRSFTAKRDGHLVEVVADKDGRWVDREAKEAGERTIRSRRYRLLAGAAAGVLIAFASIGIGKIASRQTPTEEKLPDELEPRAELFARAWLKGDARLMRRLTDPVQERMLFAWNRRTPPPKTSAPGARDAKITIEMLPSTPPRAWLRVRFAGLRLRRGNSPLVLLLAWEERGDTWLFQPVPNLRPRQE